MVSRWPPELHDDIHLAVKGRTSPPGFANATTRFPFVPVDQDCHPEIACLMQVLHHFQHVSRRVFIVPREVGKSGEGVYDQQLGINSAGIAYCSRHNVLPGLEGSILPKQNMEV